MHAQLLNGPLPGACIERILQLDRENMSAILAASGLSFPEAARRAGLNDPQTFTIMMVDGDELAGYVELTADREIAGGLYAASLQCHPRYRDRFVVAGLLAEMALLLPEREFSAIRTHVQRQNRSASELLLRLGFREVDPGLKSGNVELVAERSALEARIIRRLTSRAARSADRRGTHDCASTGIRQRTSP